ncbi:hypothetical protein [Arcanobacterium phocae]|uniref:hypothetical protein n=1 Tax=Arcanobacterium phocae TaxID=131112 RepID=UPI001C0EF169|nr:hypothetical protein [Arcanobacterium phocae]
MLSELEAKGELKENLSVVQLQKEQELAEEKEAYELPAGGTFEVEYSFLELTGRLSEMDDPDKQGSSAEDKVEVEKVWYEPEYFKSDALVQ